MRNFVSSEIDGAPVLSVAGSLRGFGCRLKLHDSADSEFANIDFYAPNVEAERMRRAVDAFNQEMQREHDAHAQAAE